MKKYFSLLILIPCVAIASQHERYYQKQWCELKGGQMEVVLDDKTRVDCLLDEYAIEVDFARKWAEAIGQSLHYAAKANKEAGILLIINKESDCKFIGRVKGVIDNYKLPIKVWVTGDHECLIFGGKEKSA